MNTAAKEKVQIKTEMISVIKNKVNLELAKIEDSKFSDYYIKSLIDKLALITDADPEELMEKYFYAVWILTHGYHNFNLDQKLAENLLSLASQILRSVGIHPQISKASFLYLDLYLAAANYNLLANNPWLSIWQKNFGEYLSRDSKIPRQEGQDYLFIAKQSFQIGHVKRAFPAFYQAEMYSNSNQVKAEARIGRIQCLRFLGELNDAMALGKLSLKEKIYSEDTKKRIRWILALINLQKEGNFEPLLTAYNVKSDFFDIKNILDISFTIFASNSKKHRDKIIKPSTFRYHFSTKIKAEPSRNVEFKALQKMQFCFDTKEGLIARYKVVYDLLDFRYQLSFDYQLLILAALSRMLYRMHQYDFSFIILDEYRSLSLKISHGQRQDILDILGDMIDKTSAKVSLLDVIETPDLVTSRINRILKISNIVTKVGFSSLKKRLKKQQMAKERNTKNLLQEITTLLSCELSQFKGPLMKVGQYVNLSTVASDTKENLLKLQDRSRPIKIDFKRIIKDQLKREADDLFLEWSLTPIGVGSIAQVYSAVLKNGSPVAVKIIHPNIEKAVVTDMRYLRLLSYALQYYFPKVNIKALIHGFNKIFIDECNLLKEMEKHQLVFGIFKNHPRFIIPKIFPEFCTKNIMVMEYINGVKMNEFMKTATIDQKRFLVKQIAEFLLTCSVKNGLFQLDPHGGNFLFCNDRVAFIDFGSLMHLSPDLMEIHKDVLYANMTKDPSFLYQSLVHHKIVNPDIIDQGRFATEMAPLLFFIDLQDNTGSMMQSFIATYTSGIYKMGMTASSETIIYFLSRFILRNFLERFSEAMPMESIRKYLKNTEKDLKTDLTPSST